MNDSTNEIFRLEASVLDRVIRLELDLERIGL